MTKQQILDHLKYFVLCISFSLLLTNCKNTDNEIVTEPKLENSKLTKGKLQDFEEVSTYVEQLQRNRANAMHAESDLENTNDFSIIYDQDMHIQQDAGFTTYSIPVLRETPVENTFSNLVIRFSDTYETEAFLINYTPVGSYMDDVAENELTPFTGEASIEAIVYDGSLDHLAENNNDCVNITIKYCDWENNQHGAVHLAGENCTEGYMFYVTTFVCFGDDVPSLVDIPVPGDGSPNVSDYIYYSGSAGGSGTTTTTTHPPIVIPTVPKSRSISEIPGITVEMNEWLENNPSIKLQLIEFLDEHNWSITAKEEVKLTIQAESITPTEWDYTRTGKLHGKESFKYIAAYDGNDGGNYTMYKLENGHVVCESTVRRIINPEDANTIASQDNATQNYYYVMLKEMDDATPHERNQMQYRWYNYKIPPSDYPDCVYCDIEYLFQTALENGLVFMGRYVIPFEDALIVVTGHDIYEIESSRAISGSMIVLDIVGGGRIIKMVKALKYGDELFEVAQLLTKYMDDIFKTQKKNIDDILKGRKTLETGNNIRKGNFGEMVTDTDLTARGYQPLHQRVTNLDEASGHGIDGVFKNPETGEYLIVESKYNTAGLGDTIDGRQMSDSWIQGTVSGNNRLADIVGPELADEIVDEGYKRIISRIMPDGTNTYKVLDSSGNIVEIWFP